jgi:uncharacterized membrane protein (DUF2068 family)
MILRLIALFRWVKAVALIGAALGTLHLLHPGAADVLMQWAAQFPPVVQQAVAKLSGLPERKIHELAVGLFAYAALFIVEGSGLWFQKRWGEWLTVVATTSFIPFEVYELMKHATAMRAALLVSNIAIVIYLVWRRMREWRRDR